MKLKLFYWTSLLLNALFLGCTSQMGPKAISSAQNIMEWEVLENSLTASNDKETYEQLQGQWSAYKGLSKEGERVSIMDVENFTLEIRDSTYRSNEELRFKPFLLKQNVIYNPITGGSTIIEKLTDKELITTFTESDIKSTRYYFEKVFTKENVCS